MKKLFLHVLLIGPVFALATSVGLSLAQRPQTPEGGVQSSQDVGIESNVTGNIPIQGRLTDASGNPLNGDYNVTARIYATEIGGTLLCGGTYSLTVDNGLFNIEVGGCSALVVSGAQLYVGIQVGSDPEMIPRQPIYPVPYAWSLRPGAIISNTATSGHGLEVWSAAGPGASGSALWVENTNASGIALWATNSSATNDDAALIVGNSGTGPLIKGFGGNDGEEEFRVDNNGDVSQDATSNGLVKAAVVAKCTNTDSTIYRSFNNVTGAGVSIANGGSAGICILDFGFGISGRYWMATSTSNSPYFVSCALYPEVGTHRLVCYVYDHAGSTVNNSSITVTMY